MIERWVQGLSEQKFSAEEMADAAWLSLLRYRLSGQLENGQTSPTVSEKGDMGTDNQPPGTGKGNPGTDGGKKESGGSTGTTGTGNQSKEPQKQPVKAALVTKQQRATSAEGGRMDGKSTPVKVRNAPALREPLTLVRALRPLIRQIATDRNAGLDEAATAQKIADEGIWLPVTRPQMEPWLDLALVVDESPSMVIWRRTVWELVRLVKNYGAFRDVRVWGLISAEQLAKATRAAEVEGSDTDSESSIAVKIPQQMFIRPDFGGAVTEKSLRRPEILIDLNQRRLILVLSDCVSSFWQTGLVLPALQTWEKAGPLALMQMLPEWMWPRTVLRFAEKIDLYGLEPATTNQQLIEVRDRFSDALEPELKRQNIRVPVLTLEVAKVSVWSEMVGGKGSTPAPGVIFNSTVQRLLLAMEQQRQFKPPTALSPQQQVQRFKVASTLKGRRLAGLLAAAPVINLQIIRLIQETLVRESEPVHVAEVLLGGLMSPVMPHSMGVNPDEMEYKFKNPEIRVLLLEGTPGDDATEILMKVSAYVNRNLNCNTLDEFVAELQQWLERESAEDADEVKPFAVVTVEVLKRRGRLSKVQQRLVKTVEERYPKPPGPSGDPGEQFWQLETYEAITLESWEPREYQFQVGRIIQRETGEWGVEREEASAPGIVQFLKDDLELELVEIPAGQFVMGAPEEEKDSPKNERPQQLITIPKPFHMGCYPITQAQWREVASWGQVDRELEPEPARFTKDYEQEGDRWQRPVEKISWYDAMEFCARLSQKTGFTYRLPSEAEWEYACRAVTKEWLTEISQQAGGGDQELWQKWIGGGNDDLNPSEQERIIQIWNQYCCQLFYFGKTLTAEVANYDASYTYNNGPQGIGRKQTTPVGHFKVTNQFGLHDMHGNVWEWCLDEYHGSLEGIPKDGKPFRGEQENGSIYILRGGSWLNLPRLCRSAFRSNYDPDLRDSDVGLRVVCERPRLS
ncbi:MAG: formylglycine-generating enzyme family protein [Snowella sp.]|nr:formylglycine-generating enzyme family protein [Snowella sp.]